MALFARFRLLDLYWLALAFFLCTKPSLGASSPTKELESSRDAYRRGAYREAAETARRAADQLASAGNSLLYSDALEQFAQSSWAAGQSLAPTTLRTKANLSAIFAMRGRCSQI